VFARVLTGCAGKSGEAHDAAVDAAAIRKSLGEIQAAFNADDYDRELNGLPT
jgi:hypothetical protein